VLSATDGLGLSATDDRPRRPLPPRASLRRRGPLLVGLLGLVLVLAGCSQPGATKDFNDQTQQNFDNACKAANDANPSDERVDELCGCWYDEIVGEDGISFDQFKAEDENIREAIDAGRFNNDGDFQREAPGIYRIVTETCLEETGPQAS
jgi:hypothetical protein